MIPGSLATTTIRKTRGDYTIDQSIRFNDNDSAYLTRTPGSASDKRTWTFSVWTKRGNLGADRRIFTAANNGTEFFFDANDKLNFYHYSGGFVWQYISSALFRDPAAWYHFVLRVDTTDATAGNRIRVYANGEQITDWGTSTAPSLNVEGFVNGTSAHYIGRYSGSDNNHWDGYLAEINHVDGSSLAPTEFGETNSDTGQWVPVRYTGSYGTNGFYLKGEDSSDLGNDSSGNNNDFTSSGLAAADQVTDSPTINQATLNPLFSGVTLSDGNLVATASGNSYQRAFSTFAIDDGGKHVCEFQKSSGTFGLIGIMQNGNHTNKTGNSNMFGINLGNGEVFRGNPTASVLTTLTAPANSLMRLEYDSSTDTLEIFDDGSSIYSGTVSLTGHDSLHFGCAPYGSGTVITATFSPLSGTPTTDFKELTAANLDDPTIADGSEYFHPQLYTGTGSSGLSVTNDASAGDFKPDILWLAPRSNGDNKVFFDSVRGTTQRVKSNTSDAEDTDGTAQITFETDGFDLDTTDSNFNGSSRTYVAWQWHTTGGTSGSNTDGDITSTVSASATSGVSVLTYTGNGSDNQEIGHGIGIAPKMIITKRRDSSGNWTTYHDAVGINKVFYLNLTNAAANNTEQYRAVPTSSVYTVGVGGDINSSGGTYVAYCFAEVDGFSKFGGYEGNGSTDGPFVYTGFKPRFVMIKRYSSTESWPILDTARGSGNFGSAAGTGGTNPTAGNDLNAVLVASTNAAEEDNPAGSRRASFLSNGFKVRTTNTAMNASGSDYLYMAFAESPFKTATAR